MRVLVVAAVTAVVTGGIFFGLRWAGLVSHDAMVIGTITGVTIAVVGAIASRRRS